MPLNRKDKLTYMNSTKLLIIFLLATLFASAQQNNIHTSTNVPYQELKAGFANTPAEARLRCYWWWLNSMATKESITRDLEEMKDKGYGGASLVDAEVQIIRLPQKQLPDRCL